jgi:hypothetical protein
MSFDGSFINGSDYSILVVESRRAADQQYFLSGTGGGGDSNDNLHLGYKNSAQIRQGHYSNDYDIAVDAFVTDKFIPRIHSFTLGQNRAPAARVYTLNGDAAIEVDRNTTPISTWYGSNIGFTTISSQFYNGDIAEIIMFSRRLRDSERDEIITYLGEKYSIPVF